MTRRMFWLVALVESTAVIGLPWLGTWVRRRGLPQCGLDGAPIEPIYAVRMIDADGKHWQFCCVLCAEYWLARQSREPRDIRVVDEATGQELAPGKAFFARSSIVTNAATGNRVHVFRYRDDAQRHVAANGGRLLDGSERPLQGRKAAERRRGE